MRRSARPVPRRSKSRCYRRACRATLTAASDVLQWVKCADAPSATRVWFYMLKRGSCSNQSAFKGRGGIVLRDVVAARRLRVGFPLLCLRVCVFPLWLCGFSLATVQCSVNLNQTHTGRAHRTFTLSLFGEALFHKTFHISAVIGAKSTSNNLKRANKPYCKLEEVVSNYAVSINFQI